MPMIYKLVPILFLAIASTSCAGTIPEKVPAVTNAAVACTDPRPQICTQDYTPVCATRDTGIRCVTTPCPATEDITYSNGCSACSDKNVISYRPGSCEAR
ncbi:MAG: hypothetical protein KAS94_14490 [Desulfobulbaceae bacterium]|nr:hypothetical protein [Desulfobulbaceae bacterium]